MVQISFTHDSHSASVLTAAVDRLHRETNRKKTTFSTVEALEALDAALESGIVDHRVLLAAEIASDGAEQNKNSQDANLNRSYVSAENTANGGKCGSGSMLSTLATAPKPVVRSAELERIMADVQRILDEKRYAEMVSNVKSGEHTSEDTEDDRRIVTGQLSGVVNVLLTFAAVFTAAFFTARTITLDYGLRILVALPIGLLAGFAEGWFYARDLLSSDVSEGRKGKGNKGNKGNKGKPRDSMVDEGLLAKVQELTGKSHDTQMNAKEKSKSALRRRTIRKSIP